MRPLDDSVMGFEKEQTAPMFLADVPERFAKYGLSLDPDKTRLIQFGRFASDRRRRSGKGRPETFGIKYLDSRCASKRLSFLSSRSIWKCLDCKKQFSVKVGTIFEGSPIGLDKWLCAMWMLVNCKKRVSSYEVARALEVSQKAAWFMLQRIRHAMHPGSINKMSGTIEADETFIGGKARNMHAGRRERVIRGRGRMGKAIVFGLLDRETGKVRTEVVGNRSKSGLQPIIRANVAPGAELNTDALKSYVGLDE